MYSVGVNLDASSNFLHLLPLGVPTLIIADDPQLIAAARAAYPLWSAVAPVAEPEIELRLAIGRVSSASVSLAISVKGSRLELNGEGVRGSADSVARTARATISPEIAADAGLFAEVSDTLLLFLLTRNGRTPVHAAAFLLGDTAVVLAGPSGAGKSTLALAAAERNYPIFSDDTVYVQRDPTFAMWGFPRPIHVYPKDAPAGEHPMRDRNGKLKAMLPCGAPVLRADKCSLILLERGPAFDLRSIEPSEAVERLMDLDAGFDLLAQDSRAALQALASRGSWLLTLGKDPSAAIDLVVRSFAGQ